MSDSLLLYGFFIGIIVVGCACMVLSLLQVRQVQRTRRAAHISRRLHGAIQPTVTVLVYAHNKQSTILRTIRGLQRNYYQAFDVVIVDDASSDQTGVLARQFKPRRSTFQLQVLRRRKRSSVAQALRAGYRKSRRGAIVLVITPDTSVDRMLIKRAVASKGKHDTWQVAAGGVRLPKRITLSEIGHILEKNYWQVHDTAMAYTVGRFLMRHTKFAHRTAYHGVVRTGVGVLFIVLSSVGAWLLFGPILFWYLWVIVTAYGIAAIWLRYGVPLRDRLILTLSIPLALFLIPVTGSMREISQGFIKK